MQPTVEMRQDEWTVAAVQALDVEEWWRYEVVDGALVVSPAAGGTHELVSEELRAALRPQLPSGAIVVGPIGLALPRSYLVPDLVVCARSILRGVNNLEPADALLVVEIVSPGSVSMDRVLKPAKYAAAGVAAFWRVETDPVSLTAYALRDGTYAELGSWRSGGTAVVPEPFPVTVVMDALAP